MSDVVVHGKWSKFEERGEWRQFEIDVPGKQYPVRVSTKLPELIARTMALRDQDATFTYTEKDSDKISEKTGKPYVNRYLNSIEAGHIGAQTQPAQRGKEDLSAEAVARIEEQQRRSFMSYSWGHAIELYGQQNMETPSDFKLLFAVVQSLQRSIYADITGSWGAERDPSYFPSALRPEEAAKPELSEHDDNIPF